MRKIPATMATQHPDNACAPYWEKDGDAFVSTSEEVEECFSSLHDLGCEEFMWDWEGKYVEEAVVERLFQKHYDFFSKHPLGKEKFLTFRIPNIWQEKGHSLSRAMMCILAADDIARHFRLHAPPLFEVIMPMTKRASEIAHIEGLFHQLSHFTNGLFRNKNEPPSIRVMPLFEGIDDLFNSRHILEAYLPMRKKIFGASPEYLRVHIARSDPALNSGMVAAVVAGKIALSEFYRFGDQHGIKMFPAIGVGSLPFRGGLSPERVSDFLAQYGGIRTAYVQSAFRYDHPFAQVTNAIRRLNRELPHTKPHMFEAPGDINEAKKICDAFQKSYRQTVERLAPVISKIALSVPKRRERKQHVGLFGYSRRIGSKNLPRAIPFTAAMYSLGIPPEFFGTGFGLQAAQRADLDVSRFYPNLVRDLKWAARFVNVHNLQKMEKRGGVWKRVAEDIIISQKILGIELGPQHDRDYAHRELSTRALQLWQQGKPLGEEIIASGKIRRSLG